MKKIMGILMVREVCCTCGIPFHVPKRYHERLEQSHEEFSCPNGHWQYFPTEDEIAKEEG